VQEREFDLAASVLRADASDARALAEALAQKLSVALPEQTKIRRRSPKLLSRNKQVERVEVQLGTDTFLLSVLGTGAEAARAKTVHGVVIKREELPLDQWLETLLQALAAEARRSETTRLALERLLD
jgi:hypothetical protein